MIGWNRLVGYRKLITALAGISGIVLVQVLGAPQSEVDSLVQAVGELAAQSVATLSIMGAVWAHITTQGRIDRNGGVQR